MLASHDPIIVAAVQMRAEPRDVRRNLDHAGALFGRAADAGAGLVLFPELFNVGYFISRDLFDCWERDDGRTVTWMRDLAARQGAIVGGSIAERRGERLFNTLFLAEPDGRLHRYAKRQPFGAENAAFDAGDDEAIVDSSLGRIGCAVCADVNWGRTLLRPLAGNIDLFVQPQASSSPKWLGRWMWQRERKHGRPFLADAVAAMGAPMVLAGLVGPVQRITRFAGAWLHGGTYVTDASGNTLANVPFDEEGVAVATVTPGSGHADPMSRVFRDPGFGRALLGALLIEPPNLRPAHRRGGH